MQALIQAGVKTVYAHRRDGHRLPGAGVAQVLIPSCGMDINGSFGQYFTVPAGAVGLTVQVANNPRTGTISNVMSIAQLGLYDLLS